MFRIPFFPSPVALSSTLSLCLDTDPTDLAIFELTAKPKGIESLAYLCIQKRDFCNVTWILIIPIKLYLTYTYLLIIMFTASRSLLLR